MSSIVKSIFGSSSTNVQFPSQSPEEVALLREQTAILRQQQSQLQESLRQQNLLQPLLFGQLGIEETRDASGQVTGYKRSGPQAEIDQLLQERQLAALKGDLPVDPRFEKDRAASQVSFEEMMARELGSGWRTSTPGLDASTAFDSETEGLRYGIRHGELTTADALARGRQQQTFGGIMGAGTSTLPFINTGTQIASGFSGPLSSMLQDRTGQLQASAANASNKLTARGQDLGFTASLFNSIFAKK